MRCFPKRGEAWQRTGEEDSSTEIYGILIATFGKRASFNLQAR
jgi:hypothetical protein